MCCTSDNRIIQSVLIAHNVIDIIAFSFHLSHKSLENYANKDTVRYFDKIHKDSHSLEPLLHTVCFIGDLVAGYQQLRHEDFIWKQLVNLRTAGRICHSVSHFLSSASFLVKNLKVVNLSPLQPFFHYQILLNALGHALCLTSAVWTRYTQPLDSIQDIKKREKEARQRDIDLGMFGGGFIAESLDLVSNWSKLDDYSSTIGTIASLAGITKCVASCINILPVPHKKECKKDCQDP